MNIFMRWIHSNHQWLPHNTYEAGGNFLSFFPPDFFGAFFGALFAFLFGMISYRIIKKYERFVLHKSTLVHMDRLLNEHLEYIGHAQYRIGVIKGFLVKRNLTFNRLIEIPTENRFSVDLGSLKLINEYFPYEKKLQRVNSSFQELNYALGRFEDTIIAGRVLENGNFDNFVEVLEGKEKELPLLLKDTKRLLAIVRVNIFKLNGKGLIFSALETNWDLEVSKEELGTELDTLESEIAQNQKEN